MAGCGSATPHAEEGDPEEAASGRSTGSEALLRGADPPRPMQLAPKPHRKSSSGRRDHSHQNVGSTGSRVGVEGRGSQVSENMGRRE
jgi:hypothetical protein